MFDYNQQDNPTNGNAYCNITNLPATDYTGTVNLASFNNMRTLTTSAAISITRGAT